MEKHFPAFSSSFFPLRMEEVKRKIIIIKIMAFALLNIFIFIALRVLQLFFMQAVRRTLTVDKAKVFGAVGQTIM